MKKRFLDKRILICAIGTILILLKMYFENNFFLLLNLVVISSAIILEKKEYKPIYLFFMLPYIYILKFSNDSTSMFNVFSLIYILDMVVYKLRNNEKVDILSIVLFFMLTGIILTDSIMSSKFDFLETTGWLINLIILYFILKENDDSFIWNKYIFSFSMGILITGIVGIMFIGDGNPIGKYLSNMRRTNTVIANGELNYRYCGFDLDPNYYALQVLIAFWGMFISDKVISKHHYTLNATLILIGLMTVSKMYIFTLILSGAIYMVYSFKTFKLIKKIKISNVIFIVALIISLVVLINKYVLPSFKARMEIITNIDDLTTGRSTAWNTYLNYIFSNTKTMIIGDGVGTAYLNGQAPHSTYILVIYRLGILGTIIFLAFLFSVFGKMKNRIFNIQIIPLIVLLATNFALDVLDFDTFPYVMAIVIMVYKLELSEGEKNEAEEGS